jgi:hypothetical protein
VFVSWLVRACVLSFFFEDRESCDANGPGCRTTQETPAEQGKEKERHCKTSMGRGHARQEFAKAAPKGSPRRWQQARPPSRCGTRERVWACQAIRVSALITAVATRARTREESWAC